MRNQSDSLFMLPRNYSGPIYDGEGGSLRSNATRKVKIMDSSNEEGVQIVLVCAVSFAIAVLLFGIICCLWKRLHNCIQRFTSRAERFHPNLSSRNVQLHATRVTDILPECRSSNSMRSDRATYAPSSCSRDESLATNDSDELSSRLHNLKLFCKNKPKMNNEKEFSIPQRYRADTSAHLSPGINTLWSSIDFDDFEESAIHENTRKTHSEGAFSTLFTEASISACDLINSNSALSVEPYTQRPSTSLFHLKNPSPEMVTQVLNFLRDFIPGNRNVELSLKIPPAQETADTPSVLRPWASVSEKVNVTPSAPEWEHDKHMTMSKTPSELKCTHHMASTFLRGAFRPIPLRKSEFSIDNKIKVATISTSSYAINKNNNLPFSGRPCSSKLCLRRSMDSKLPSSNKWLGGHIPRSHSVLPSVSFKASSAEDDDFCACVINANRKS